MKLPKLQRARGCEPQSCRRESNILTHCLLCLQLCSKTSSHTAITTLFNIVHAHNQIKVHDNWMQLWLVEDSETDCDFEGFPGGWVFDNFVHRDALEWGMDGGPRITLF